VIYPDLIDVPCEIFGGYTPAIPPSDLPPGASPNCPDVIFPQAGVRTRGGLFAAYSGAPIIAGASINGLKSYVTPSLGQRLLGWDSLGNFYKEFPQGTLNLLFSRPYAGLFYRSLTLFGREYQAFRNGVSGFDIPRQYDDTNWDRVSQVGPGASPSASDDAVALTVLSRTAGVISATTAAPHGLVVGGLVNIAGVGADGSFNGQWPVAGVPSPTQFTAWGSPGISPISDLVRAADTVTATLGVTPSINPGDSVVVYGADDESFDGIFTAISVSGNTVTWAQVGDDAVTAGGTLYNQTASAQVVLTDVTGMDTVYLIIIQLQAGQPLPFVLGGNITITGNTNGAWNHTFVISGIQEGNYFGAPPPGAIQWTLFQNGSGSPGGGYGGVGVATLPDSTPVVTGLAGPAGHTSAGLHQISVAFITRQGFIGPAAVPIAWVSAGGFLINAAQIPTGPPNVIGRLILVTPAISSPATTGSFYSMPTGSTEIPSSVMYLDDNVTTMLTFDFQDAVLISSFQANYLFTQLELGECAFAAGYNSRLVWLGERNKQPNFVNMTFDGGFSAAGLPLGWTPGTNSAGGGSALAAALSADWGDAYAITGDGATAVVGQISQSAFQDYLLTPIIGQNTAYRIRVRLASAGPLLAGTVHINLSSVIGGFTTTGISIAAAQLTTDYQEFDALLITAQATVPPDLLVNIYADGTPSAGGTFLIDSIEPYPTQFPFNNSTARFSHAFNPESYDSTTGQIQVRPNDGQSLRAGFPLRNNFYLAKDHYLCYVTDDGVNEPASWDLNEVSGTIGICGPDAVDWTEEWAVFADRSGLYITWGSDPVKITQEIQSDASLTGKPSWNSINWAAAGTIWVRIDSTNRRILVGAPINGAATPNIVFVLDYVWLDSPEDIATSPLVVFSTFTGKILGHGRGRRWTYWNITANSMCFAERTDGSAQPFFGNGVGNAKIYQQIDAPNQLSDDGVAINSFWTSHYSPSSVEEQQFQFGAHRKLMGYLKWRAIGAGYLTLFVNTAQRTTTLRPYALSLAPPADGGRGVNVHGERFSIQMGTNAVGSYFQLEKLIPSMKKDSAIPVRGTAA
jgi:hypothetical protein